MRRFVFISTKENKIIIQTQNQGKILLLNETFIGGMRNLKKHGLGIVNSSYGQKLEALWINDQLQVGTSKQACYDGTQRRYIDYTDQDNYQIQEYFDNIITEYTYEKGEICRIKFPYGQIYAGQCLNKKPHGFGQTIFQSGEVWEGTWVNGKPISQKPKDGNLDSQNNVFSVVECDLNGEIKRYGVVLGDKYSYSGELKYNKPHGYGIYTTDEGLKIEGNWNQGNINSGKVHFVNKLIYEGQFNQKQCFQAHGQGVLTFPQDYSAQTRVTTEMINPDYAKGIWVDGRLPQGKILFVEGQIYEGKLNEKYQPHGYGCLTYLNGIQVVADWRNGSIIYKGMAKLKYENGSTYTGCVNMDVPHGYGTKTYTNGTKLQGKWTNGYISPSATLINSDESSDDIRFSQWLPNHCQNMIFQNQQNSGKVYKTNGSSQVISINYRIPLKKNQIYISRYEKKIIIQNSQNQKSIIKTHSGCYQGSLYNFQENDQGMYKSYAGWRVEGVWFQGQILVETAVFYQHENTLRYRTYTDELNYQVEVRIPYRDRKLMYTIKNGNQIDQVEIKFKSGEIYYGEIEDYYPHGFGQFTNLYGQSFLTKWFLGHIIFDKSCAVKVSDHVSFDCEGATVSEITVSYDIEMNIRYNQCGTYHGEVESGKPNGYGVYRFYTNTKFEGIWKNGKIINGKITYTDKQIYQGLISNWKPHAQGILTSTIDSDRVSSFEGIWIEGTLPKGKIIYRNGRIYEGQLNENLIPHGNGCLTIVDHCKIICNWDHGNCPMFEKIQIIYNSGSISTFSLEPNSKGGVDLRNFEYEKHCNDDIAQTRYSRLVYLTKEG